MLFRSLGTRDETLEARAVWDRVLGNGLKGDKWSDQALWLLNRKDGKGVGARDAEEVVETQ